MEEKTEMLHKLCDALSEEMEDYAKKIEKSDGMSAGDLEAIDKLSHALKSVKTTLAMMESDGGYSGRTSGTYSRGRGYSYKRDRMGRYSYADGMDELLEEMRSFLPSLSEEKRRKAERLIDELM